MSNKLIIFSAPSGAGKTTIVKHLLSQSLGLEFSISAASREKRPREVHGRDYYFLSAEEFKAKIKNNEFIEWEEVYENHFYGTLKSEVDRIWSNGNSVIFDVDVIGGLNIKKQYGDKALAVFVMPPSLDELRNRLTMRSTESPENLKKRIEKSEAEISFSDRFDTIIVNDNLEDALNAATILVKGFLNQK
jgi:guanylate kinase